LFCPIQRWEHLRLVYELIKLNYFLNDFQSKFFISIWYYISLLKEEKKQRIDMHWMGSRSSL
jgi:hypothetical protein